MSEGLIHMQIGFSLSFGYSRSALPAEKKDGRVPRGQGESRSLNPYSVGMALLLFVRKTATQRPGRWCACTRKNSAGNLFIFQTATNGPYLQMFVSLSRYGYGHAACRVCSVPGPAEVSYLEDDGSVSHTLTMNVFNLLFWSSELVSRALCPDLRRIPSLLSPLPPVT